MGDLKFQSLNRIYSSPSLLRSPPLTFTRAIDHLLAKSLESGVVTHSTRFVIEYSLSFYLVLRFHSKFIGKPYALAFYAKLLDFQELVHIVSTSLLTYVGYGPIKNRKVCRSKINNPIISYPPFKVHHALWWFEQHFSNLFSKCDC